MVLGYILVGSGVHPCTDISCFLGQAGWAITFRFCSCARVSPFCFVIPIFGSGLRLCILFTAYASSHSLSRSRPLSLYLRLSVAFGGRLDTRNIINSEINSELLSIHPSIYLSIYSRQYQLYTSISPTRIVTSNSQTTRLITAWARSGRMRYTARPQWPMGF
ncbi:hypothetical protein BJX61DRAFT_349736 [Aspergillus egyptiacus]|nr:hypothetical protein BJX61DRAFT_349736 [Aspergillus egyptiacus]